MGFICIVMLTIMTRDGGDFEATRVPFNREEITKVEDYSDTERTARSKVYLKRPIDQRAKAVLVFETPLQVKAAPCVTSMQNK